MSGLSQNSGDFLYELEKIIQSRKSEDPSKSYTSSLLNGSLTKILQKVGEESVEYILEATGTDRGRIISEASDLIYHFLVSLQAQGFYLQDISQELRKRHEK